MRRTIRAVTTTLLALASAVLVTASASAQAADGPAVGAWTGEAQGGIALPLGITREVQDLGPTVEAAVGYRVHPRVRLRADASVSFLQGADASSAGRPMPNMTIYRVHGGAEVLLLSPSSRMRVAAGLGAGAATYDTEVYERTVENPATGQVEGDFNHTWFTTSGRLKVLYAVAPRADVFVAGAARASLADEDATAVFGVFDPAAGTRGTDVIWTLPVTAGVQLRF